MTLARFLDGFQLGVLACWGGLGIGRALRLYARGVPVVAIDWERTPLQMLADSLLALVLLSWLYAVVAYAWPLPAHLVVPWLSVVPVDAVAAKVAGALMLVAGLVAYALALRAFGDSWRLGIDRKGPGPLVTDGIFAWTRNPIFVSLDLLILSAFLIQGRLLFLVLAVGCVALIHEQIQREERFLAATYGDAYRDYCGRVGRYATWRSRRDSR